MYHRQQNVQKDRKQRKKYFLGKLRMKKDRLMKKMNMLCQCHVSKNCTANDAHLESASVNIVD